MKLSIKFTSFLFVLIVISALAGCNSSDTQTNTPATEQVAWVQSGDTYSYIAEYEVPEHTMVDTFTVSLDEDGVVTSAQVIVPEDGGKHAEGLVRFNTALEPVIVGKSLSEIGEFDTLGGYSITTDAFNQGIQELQAQVSSNT